MAWGKIERFGGTMNNLSESVDTFGIPVVENPENEAERLSKEIEQIKTQMKASDYGSSHRKDLEFRLTNREERLKKIRDNLNRRSAN